jgi:hypothetical protein
MSDRDICNLIGQEIVKRSQECERRSVVAGRAAMSLVGPDSMMMTILLTEDPNFIFDAYLN